ncbi:putative bifunctional diguanylate cyclase/phosphodiesterase [Aureimonas flava]|nr:bifunctional diguanylate cyclase/phosphodiesterase [Aureimonas flava]
MHKVTSFWNEEAGFLRELGRSHAGFTLAWIGLTLAGLLVTPWLGPVSLVAFVVTFGQLGRLHRTLRRTQGDLDTLRVEQQELVERHVIDEITGLLTRRAFLEAAGEAIGSREAGKSLAFFALDMDNLKILNDSFGHRAGDFALFHIATTLTRLAPRAVAGRLGGDEFAFVLPCADEDEALAFGERLGQALNKPVMAGGRRLSLSASLGVAMVPERTHYLSEAMQFADVALYAAKKAGRNKTCVFDAEMLSELKHRRLIERELRAAILLNELDLHYQPIQGPDGHLVAVEALLRWQSPSRGNISPARFIPIAESTALIDQLGEWVLRRALTDAGDLPNASVSVNVSANQLTRDDVVDMVARVLEETDFPPSRLVLELTESAAINATPDICRRLQSLRDMGIRIALDDFGTGFCGFDYLRHLPVDTIKIDRSYIARLGDSETDNVFVSALASLASAMRLNVVAEGIETEKQMLLARAAGCNLFQGYHLARPMPKADIVRMHDHALRKCA